MLETFVKMGSLSTSAEFGNDELANLLRGRWDEIRVEQMGAEEVVVIEPDEIATMLRLTLPEDLLDEIERTVDPHVWKSIEETVLIQRLGSERALQHMDTSP